MQTSIPGMRYRKLDKNGDMLMGIGQQQFVDDLEAVRQAVETRIKLLFGEWWEREWEGVPQWQRIIGAPRTEAQRAFVDLVITQRIVSTINVISVHNVDSFYTDRTYTYTCRVRAVYGEFDYEVVIG